MAYQIDDKTAVGSLPTLDLSTVGDPGYFSDGDPITGQPATVVRSDWLNMVQEEILGVVTGAGLSPDKTNNGQLFAAIKKLIPASVTSPPVSDTVYTVDTLGIDRQKNRLWIHNAVTGDFLFLQPAGDYQIAGNYQPAGDYATNAALRASMVPAWVPLPCPFPTAPAGFVLAQGQSFPLSQFPQLAAAYPSGNVPDMRGLFMRGWDPTGTVDRDGASRGILSVQEGSVMVADGVSGNCTALTAVSVTDRGNDFTKLGWDLPTVNPSLSLMVATSDFGAWGSANNQGGEPLGIARPKNVSWNWMFRAA